MWSLDMPAVAPYSDPVMGTKGRPRPFPWQFHDGGRADDGFRGSTGDCGVRAAAIALGESYTDVYEELAEWCKDERPSKRKRRKSHPRTGMHSDTFGRWLVERRGCVW